MRTPRDQQVLDFIERFEPTQFEGSVWRVVHSQFDPLRPSRSGGRWDDESFDVLYTSSSKDGAIAEAWYHNTAGQPIPPSKGLTKDVHEIGVVLSNVLKLEMADLESAGISRERFGRISYAKRKDEYPSTQVIGEAAFFFGFEALIVPNARWPTTNTVILTENTLPHQVEVKSTETIDLIAWNRDEKR